MTTATPDAAPTCSCGSPLPARSQPAPAEFVDPIGSNATASAGSVWWDCETATLEIWAHRTSTTVELPDNTSEAVTAALAGLGWERGSGWAWAADSDTVRYAAIDPIEDHRDAEHT